MNERADRGLIEALPGMVRIAAGAWWRTAEWTVNAYVRAGARVAQAAVSGESAAELLRQTGAEMREYARRLLDLADSDDRFGRGGSRPRPENGEASGSNDRRAASEALLRERGAELLRQSADVRFDQPAHPAYMRILEELAPDEGRILRLLALEGPQAAVDVRTARPLNVGSQLVAPGLSMIGSNAGCRYLDRLHAYLNNLYRLGLVWFSREPLQDPLRYQVLEAQPDVLAAMRKAGRAKTVRRTIHLTPFGEDFCATCLPLHTAELDALPGDAARSEADAGADPVSPGPDDPREQA